MRVRVRDVMTDRVVTTTPDTPLKQAAVELTRHRISGLPVVDEGRLVGIITESDFVDRLADEGDSLLALLLGRSGREITGRVKEVMTADPHTISPDAPVEAAARKMVERRVKRLPVVDGSGRLVGVISRADLVAVFARPDETIAADIINEGVVGLLGSATDAVRVTVSHGVVRLSGTVDSVTEKRMLEEFSRRVAGVVAVESELEAAFDDTQLPPM